MSTVGRIVKDGLQAFVVWLVISVALIYFFGYPGRMIAMFIGVIFLVCFCALRAAELLAFTIGLFRRQPAPPPSRPPSAPPKAQPQLQYCPKCGSAWVAGAARCANCG